MSYKVSTGPREEQHPVRKYRVLSKRCVWGKRGDTIERAFHPRAESSLLRAGTLELIPDVPKFEPKAFGPAERPLKSADKEG